jgi:glycosyltransferase involved in cell wall biosynthesis
MEDIHRLNTAGIPYTYKELPSFDVLNEMYNSLDLYLVTARYEGGPQSLVECGLTKTPVISTNVGLAQEILNPCSYTDEFKDLIKCSPDVAWAFKKSKQISMKEKGFNPFLEMFENIKVGLM